MLTDPPAILDDAALSRLVATADPVHAPAAEAELCRRLAPRIRAYGLRHLRDAHAAADLVQQVLLATIEKLRAGELRDADRLAPFVSGVCRMTVLAMRRGQARRDALLARHGSELVPATAAEPPADVERVAGCLDKLSPRERSVLLMSFYEERAADEVAALLGLTAGNVRVIRHRGLARLRDCVTGGRP